jgi:hypothetical protein
MIPGKESSHACLSAVRITGLFNIIGRNRDIELMAKSLHYLISFLDFKYNIKFESCKCVSMHPTSFSAHRTCGGGRLPPFHFQL